MKTTTTFAILIWINASRAKNNEAELFARITVNQKRVNISLKRKVNIDSWDKAKSRVKGTNQEARIINAYIDQTQTALFQAYQDLKAERKVITSQAIKSRFLGLDEQHYSLQDIIDYHNENTSHKLHKDTIGLYKTTQRYLMEFVLKEFKTNDIYLRDLNYSFVLKFDNFLRAYKMSRNKKLIGNNTIIKHIQRLRKMVTMAFHIEWINRDPFVKYKPVFDKTERGFLSAKELEAIENFTTDIERLRIVKDLFIFSCYTGIAYVDIMKLSKNNILLGIDGGQWIVTKRQKTNTQVKVPVLKQTQLIINKYKNNLRVQTTGTLLPVLSNQKLNSYLKEISDVCKIKKNLTFHMARHTFATTVTLTNGVPIETVSKLLGHTKLATTQIYAKVIERKVSDDMNALKVLLDNKSTQNSVDNRRKSSS
ncbi:Site-specific recombinase XerD [Lutibacter agarilyticus]|uniref:Site-specific recombinase XerD n=1 Tax=Lutibacter agarilyticus TaxID=1109740 RepID=A0A238WBC8_9FLAO|nr:site-specific integrase [Lutibacter agarilyticus]SNR43850.1 Site-specific recombinase XerD [Lutibacter agarilyticus]